MPSASATWRTAISNGFHLVRVRAELGGEAQLGVIGRNAQRDAQQVKILRALAGGADDLVQLLQRVEAEGPDAVVK